MRASTRLLTCCIFVLLAGPVSAQTAALVNGEAIPLDEVEAILKHRPSPFLKISAAEYREMQLEALDMLVDDLIVQQFLRKNIPVPPSSQVTKKLKELQAALKTQGKTYEEYCKESGQTDAQVHTNIINMLQRNSYIASHLTPAEVRKYFDDNRDLFEQTTVRVSHVLLRLLPICGPVEQAAAERKLELVRQEIAAGKISFADAAKKYSQCPSAPSGGDLGYIGRKGAIDEAFARAAFSLPTGGLSPVVRTELGVHLLQVTERKPGLPAQFDKIEDKVREFAGEEMLLRILSEQRQQAKVEIKLTEVAGAKTNSRKQPGR